MDRSTPNTGRAKGSSEPLVIAAAAADASVTADAAADAPAPADTGMDHAPIPQVSIPQEWLEEFEAAARRPLALRMRYAFIKTYKPVLDDAKFRSFETMQDYRAWCERELPEWLGYGRV